MVMLIYSKYKCKFKNNVTCCHTRVNAYATLRLNRVSAKNFKSDVIFERKQVIDRRDCSIICSSRVCFCVGSGT